MQRKNVNQLYQKLNERADKLYQFVILYAEYMHVPRDYGTGYRIGMLDVHTLTYIDDHPGVTITQLSQTGGKTKSAFSQTVKNLANAGFVERRKERNNSKTVNLYVTEEGRRLSNAHKLYDLTDIAQTTEELLRHISQEELDTFYRVIDVYTSLFQAK